MINLILIKKDEVVSLTEGTPLNLSDVKPSRIRWAYESSNVPQNLISVSMVVSLPNFEVSHNLRNFPCRHRGRELCFRSNINLSATQRLSFTVLLPIAGSRGSIRF